MDKWIYFVFIIILIIEIISSIFFIVYSKRRNYSNKILNQKLNELMRSNDRLYSDRVINNKLEYSNHIRESLNYNFYDDDIRKLFKRLYMTQENIQEEVEKLNILLSSSKLLTKQSNKRNSEIDAAKLMEQIANMTNSEYLLELLKNDNDKKYIVTRNVISDIAHTLRTPLSGIQAILLTLQKTYPENEELLNHIAEIDKCLSQVEENIQAYQDLMLCDAETDQNGNIEFLDKLNSRLKIAMITSDKKIYIDSSNIEYISLDNATSKLILLSIDCIIENATFFAIDNSTIKVQGRTEENYYIFEIQNYGKTIDEVNLNRIFESGFSTRYSSGKGLYFVKSVIEERLGGIVGCQNLELPEQGVKFTIILDKSKLCNDKTSEEGKENVEGAID